MKRACQPVITLWPTPKGEIGTFFCDGCGHTEPFPESKFKRRQRLYEAFKAHHTACMVGNARKKGMTAKDVSVPKKFGTPWHDLVAQGYGYPLTVYQEGADLLVNHERWAILHVLSAAWHVQWQGKGPVYCVSEQPPGPGGNRWRIQRVADGVTG